eukprot:3733539-Pyramimonas_sp.AAC.1
MMGGTVAPLITRRRLLRCFWCSAEPAWYLLAAPQNLFENTQAKMASPQYPRRQKPMGNP